MTGRLFASVTAGVVLLLALLGAYSAVRPDKARGGPSPTQAITVTGTGLVTTTPDRADFSFGVQTQRASADAATAATAARMQRVINSLRASGIASRDSRSRFPRDTTTRGSSGTRRRTSSAPRSGTSTQPGR